MCGIFAVSKCGETHIRDYLAHAIDNLQYRGYDSWGFKVFNGPRLVSIEKFNRQTLDAKLKKDAEKAIAHTRWATNGAATIKNAHPITVGGNNIVHNGIVTNANELKQKYKLTCRTDTDTEVILRLWNKDRSLLKELEGSFSFVILDLDGKIWGYRRGIPLYFVRTNEANYFVSDTKACLDDILFCGDLHENRVFNLEDLDSNKFCSVGFQNCKKISRGSSRVTLRELEESREILARPDEDYVPYFFNNAVFIGSGSSYHAAMFGAYKYEGIAYIPTDIRIDENLNGKGNHVLLSQSGESYDILKAAKLLKQHNRKIISITNNPSSSLALLSDKHIDLKCGTEYGVASTKSFLAQLKVLSGKQTVKLEDNYDNIDEAATYVSNYSNLYILGNGEAYIVAKEAALKFKELALIHAEAIEGTEFKHGPLALVDNNFLAVTIGEQPVVVSQIEARGGKVIQINDGEDIFEYVYVLQKLAILTAYKKGIDPDYPRNLAKAITVE